MSNAKIEPSVVDLYCPLTAKRECVDVQTQLTQSNEESMTYGAVKEKYNVRV